MKLKVGLLSWVPPRSALYDTFGGARDEKKARLFEVYGYTFLAAQLE
jgi:hypothetical protein